jgi:hypothetical protein
MIAIQAFDKLNQQKSNFVTFRKIAVKGKSIALRKSSDKKITPMEKSWRKANNNQYKKDE